MARRETTKNAVFFQEYPGSHQAQPAFAGATNARIWRYDLHTGISTVVAEVDQSMSPVTNKGTWESSGIVDASAVFGPGAFLVDVQAHQWDMPAGTGNDPPAVPLRERGQLLLMHDGGGDRSGTVAAVKRFVDDAVGDGWEFTLPVGCD